MSKILKTESYWVNKDGITIKLTFPWYIPFKRRKLKQALFLVEMIDLVYTYDAEAGTTGDVKQRVWSKDKGVEL
jgi:hypothetical protein